MSGLELAMNDFDYDSLLGGFDASSNTTVGEKIRVLLPIFIHFSLTRHHQQLKLIRTVVYPIRHKWSMEQIIILVGHQRTRHRVTSIFIHRYVAMEYGESTIGRS